MHHTYTRGLIRFSNCAELSQLVDCMIKILPCCLHSLGIRQSLANCRLSAKSNHYTIYNSKYYTIYSVYYTIYCVYYTNNSVY